MHILRFIAENSTDEDYIALRGDETVAKVDMFTWQSNVSIKFFLNDKPVRLVIGQPLRDLLDLGALIYVADEIVSRGSTEDGWNRQIDVTHPVRYPQNWNSNASLLSDLLRQLSGDEYSFSFPQRNALAENSPRHRRVLGGDWDCVCLFSGGLDSLCGAARLLDAGERVLLVGHQADGITAAAQKRLVRILSDRFPGQVEFVQVRVARSQRRSPAVHLPQKVETSHRPRSFLFLTLATVVASALGVQRVYLPENGLIGLNAPLQVSRLGTFSTRTAHPLFIQRFNDWVAGLGLFQGQILNPFMFDSKSDVIANSPEWLREYFAETNSCAHAGSVRWFGMPGVNHCGYCVPCVYRRLSLKRIEMDSPDDYAFDVFSNLSGIDANKTVDMKAIIGFARKIQTLSNVAIETLITTNGWFDPGVVSQHGAYEVDSFVPWRAMLQGWAERSLDDLNSLCDADTKRVLSI